MKLAKRVVKVKYPVMTERPVLHETFKLFRVGDNEVPMHTAAVSEFYMQ